jgi:nitrogen fixation NifU-like protein
LDELYKDIILDHYEYPRNKGSIEGTACTCAGGDNPICGDSFDVCILLDNDHVEAIAFEGRGCAISQASASMMTEAVEGKAVAEVRRWYRTVHGLLTNRPDEVDTELDIGDLEALEGVRQYPVRIKCALLAWEALRVALRQALAGGAAVQQHAVVTTE